MRPSRRMWSSARGSFRSWSTSGRTGAARVVPSRRCSSRRSTAATERSSSPRSTSTRTRASPRRIASRASRPSRRSRTAAWSPSSSVLARPSRSRRSSTSCSLRHVSSASSRSSATSGDLPEVLSALEAGDPERALDAVFDRDRGRHSRAARAAPRGRSRGLRASRPGRSDDGRVSPPSRGSSLLTRHPPEPVRPAGRGGEVRALRREPARPPRAFVAGPADL